MTIPNSSIIDTVFAFEKQCLVWLYNLVSQYINKPCANLIISNVTIKLIGINVLNNKKYVKKFMKQYIVTLLSKGTKLP